MSGPRPLLRTLLVVAMLAIGPAVAAGATGTASSGSPAAYEATADATRSTEILLVQELHLTPERPGEITVELRYEIPDRVSAVTAELADGATVVSTDGFSANGSGAYDWDGRSASPTITYRLPANETGEVRGPEGTDGRYLFVDVGEWALVERPRIAMSWKWSGSGRVGLNRTATVDGPGAVGGSTAVLGEHRELRSAAHDQTFRLIVPAAADMREDPDDVFDAFATAGDALRVGDRDETVFAVVAPSERVPWAARGLQVGDADLWVLDGEGLDEPGDTWTHEYVHTRQSFETTTTAAWTAEAMATYYAALFAVEDGRVGLDTFQRWLSLGTRSPYRSAVLADPTTWGGARPDYFKGALVFGELDRQFRIRTEHASSAQSVFRRMNEHDRPVNGSAFFEFVEESGNQELRSEAERYATTTAVPDMWSRDAHEDAFGPSPALIDVVVADRYAVSGPFGNRSAVETPVVIAAGETLSLGVSVENTGGTAGPYEVAFRVDGSVEAQRTGQLDPGGSTTLTFDRTFERPGTYVVAAGADRMTVDVVQPATASVVDVQASRSSVRVGESVTVSATVRNDAAIPAEREVVLRRDGEAIERQTVRLAPGETRTISFSITLESPGEYRVEIADDSVIVSAEAADGGDPSPGEEEEEITVSPGTLATSAAVAVAVALLLLLRQWRR